MYRRLTVVPALAALLVLHPAVRDVLEIGHAAQADRAAAGSGSYRFMQHQRGSPGTPVTYDPCKVVRVTINTAGVPDPDHALEVVLEAMRRVSVATGLRLRYVGPSTDRPHWPSATQSQGAAAEPVLVAFATSAEVPRLKGPVAGVGGSTSVRRGGVSTYVTGQVTLDSRTFAKLLTEPAFLEAAQSILMHEFGHLVGLAHVSDDRELMYARDTGQADFGPGDRIGLARLGQGTCT